MARCRPAKCAHMKKRGTIWQLLNVLHGIVLQISVRAGLVARPQLFWPCDALRHTVCIAFLGDDPLQDGCLWLLLLVVLGGLVGGGGSGVVWWWLVVFDRVCLSVIAPPTEH